jgi:fumarate reductase flavoprotein subunit
MAVRPAAEARFEYTVPVVVIGAGACGLVAALAAAEAGAEVLVLERDESPTGSTSLSQGLIPAAGTRLQKARGIADDAALFAADLLAKAKHASDPGIVRLLAEEAGPTIDWLVDRHGLELHVVDDFLYPGHSRHRMHGPPNQTGAELEAALLGAVQRAGIDLVTGALVEDLFADPDGRIAAVGFRRPDGTAEAVGCEAVFLACNGFGGNPEMVRRFIPEIADADYFGHPGNRGDAVAWGTALGAATADMGAYQGHGSVAQPQGVLLTWAVVTEGGFQVNLEGRRFGNEAAGYSEFALEVQRQPGRVAWSLYDARCERPARAFEEYQDLLKLGAVRVADDLAELAAITGLPTAALAETFADVAACAAGRKVDAFGRDFTRTPPLAAPYRAVRTGGALFHTQGGLAVDTLARVLRADGTPLPNLFAGGGAARGVSGPASWGYLAGNGLLSAVVLGRIGGREAAARALTRR